MNKLYKIKLAGLWVLAGATYAIYRTIAVKDAANFNAGINRLACLQVESR